MTEWIWKLRILRVLLSAAYDDWRTNIAPADTGAPYCCDGRECGCGAMTWRDIYSPKDQPA